MKCLICQTDFTTYKGLSSHIVKFHKMRVETYYKLYINNNNSCIICNSSCKFDSLQRGFYKTCSKKCKYELIKQKNKKKALSTINKTKKTMNERYGVNAFTQSPKYKKIMKERYGVENSFQLQSVKEKTKQTNLKKYGTEYPMKTTAIKTKVANSAKQTYLKNTLLYAKKHNIIPLFSETEYITRREIVNSHYIPIKYNWKCTICNTEFTDHIFNKLPRCPVCNPITYGTSNIENELFLFLKEQNIKIERRKKFYTNNTWTELDIFLPDYNIGIEMNGIYWHSEEKKPKLYHKNKTTFFESINIQVIHIFENEWIYKNEIVKSIILSKLNKCKTLYARKCSIQELSTCSEFLNKNHIQGTSSASIKLGLFYNNELVSVMTFCKSRFNKKIEWELSRFCNKLNITVVGGFSKLLTYFIRTYSPKNIITYADKRYSNGNVYIKNNFTYSHTSSPNYFYFLIGTNILFSRIKFQKHKLKKILNTYNANLTEWENMQANNYSRIWDCGNKVYVLNSF